MAEPKPRVTSAREKLSGRGSKRAAALLIALGPELAGDILGRLNADDVSQLTWETFGIGSLSPAEREQVLTEAYQTVVGRNFTSAGGVEYAFEMLERTVGEERAHEILSTYGSTSTSPFAFLGQLEESDVLNAIQSEAPQVLALILAHLPDGRAASVLQGLPEVAQAEVVVRIANMERAAPDVVDELDALLRARVGSLLYGPGREHVQAGGVESLVELLRLVDPQTERAITARIEQHSPDVGDEIRRRMFVFEDLMLLDDRSVQRVLREAETSDLALALKGASDDVTGHILSNMSERAAAMLRDDMEATGPVRVRMVEEARSRIVTAIRRLETDEEIFVQRGGEEILV